MSTEEQSAENVDSEFLSHDTEMLESDEMNLEQQTETPLNSEQITDGETLNLNDQSEPQKDSNKKERILRPRDINRFPITRIRTIMKMDPDLNIASQESVFLISRAAELFVQYQAQEAYKRTKLSKRKTVQKRDIDNAINELDCMAFLEGAID